jgi:enamine deaminase RidA (YjgF/YER057c/UK114 family)
MTTAEQRVKELGLDLPAPPGAAGNYVAGVRTGNLLFLSGCGPRRADGSYVQGKLGADLDVAQGYEAARVAGLAMLARIRQLIGSLDRVARIVKALGMVNAAPDFTEQPKVIDGFSDLMVDVFGESGRGARAAVGMVTLSGGMAVEIEMVVELKP